MIKVHVRIHHIVKIKLCLNTNYPCFSSKCLVHEFMSHVTDARVNPAIVIRRRWYLWPIAGVHLASVYDRTKTGLC